MSVVAFSDGLYLAVPPVIIDGNTRNIAVAGIRAVHDGGGTYMSGGLSPASRRCSAPSSPGRSIRSILFSDGQPNIGITSRSELARIAARAAEHGVAVTTIGFGDLHDEMLMQSMADSSGGNYYYVDSPGRHGRIFQQEAGAILRSAARSTDIDMPSRPGLVLEEVIGYDYVASGGRVYVRVGSMPHDEERYVVFKFHGGRRRPGADVDLVYSDLARRGRFGVTCGPAYEARRAAASPGRWSSPAAPRPPGGCRRRWRGPTPAARFRHLAARVHARNHRGDTRAARSAGARLRGQDAAPGPGRARRQGGQRAADSLVKAASAA